jgi:hypothetical protein
MLQRVAQTVLAFLQSSRHYHSSTDGALVQKLKSEEKSGARTGVTLAEFIDLFENIPHVKGHDVLPKNAAWFILLPNSWLLQTWDWMILVLSFYFFWEVPVSWAFRTPERLGMLLQAQQNTFRHLNKISVECDCETKHICVHHRLIRTKHGVVRF